MMNKIPVLFIVAILTSFNFYGQNREESEVDSFVTLAISLSEDALFDANFEEAKNLVKLSYFQSVEDLQFSHRILLIIQDLRVSAIENIVRANRSDPMGNFERLSQFLPMISQLHDNRVLGKYFIAFSSAHRAIGNQDSASIYEDRAISSFLKIQEHKEIAQIRANNISRLHNQLLRDGKRDEILSLIPRYEEEIEFSRQYNKYALAYNTRHLGQIYRRQTNQSEAALELFQASLNLREEIGFLPFIPASHSSVGDVLVKMGRMEEAKNSYLTAVKTAQEIGFVRYQSQPLISIGDCYNKEGDKNEALEYYSKALRAASLNNYSSGIDEAIIKIRELNQ